MDYFILAVAACVYFYHRYHRRAEEQFQKRWAAVSGKKGAKSPEPGVKGKVGAWNHILRVVGATYLGLFALLFVAQPGALIFGSAFILTAGASPLLAFTAWVFYRARLDENLSPIKLQREIQEQLAKPERVLGGRVHLIDAKHEKPNAALAIKRKTAPSTSHTAFRAARVGDDPVAHVVHGEQVARGQARGAATQGNKPARIGKRPPFREAPAEFLDMDPLTLDPGGLAPLGLMGIHHDD